MDKAEKNTKEIVIHLGLPKTGTTTLQNKIFREHPDYLYLGRHNVGSTTVTEEKDRWLIQLEKDLTNKEIAYFDQYPLAKILIKQFGDSYHTSQRLFMSNEGILDRCMTPWLNDGRVRIGSPYHTMEKLRRLLDANGFGTIKVILVTRKQDDLLESFFAEEYQNFNSIYGFSTPDELAEFVLNSGCNEELDSLLRYGSFASHLDRVFGNENVLVLPYEGMRDEPEGFLKEMASFMGIPLWENAGLLSRVKENVRAVDGKKGKVARTSPLVKKLSLVKRKLFGNIQTGLGSYIKKLERFKSSKVVSMNSELKKRVMDYYKDENAILNRRWKSETELHI